MFTSAATLRPSGPQLLAVAERFPGAPQSTEKLVRCRGEYRGDALRGTRQVTGLWCGQMVVRRRWQCVRTRLAFSVDSFPWNSRAGGYTDLVTIQPTKFCPTCCMPRSEP